MKYNFRDQSGKFTIKPKNGTVVPGRLYEYNGVVVRAGKLLRNKKRLVQYHRQLNGFVSDKDLKFIDKDKVNQYLGI